ncbi:MAG: hypothetical protein ACI4EI_09710 [Muricoprocola sp.]
MKKKNWLLPSLLICLALTGCGKKAEETEAPTEAETQAVTETETQTETEPVTEAQTEPETEVADSMNKIRSLKALVKSSDDSTLTIQTERGKELKFSTTGADIQATGGITDGMNVTIVYKGVIRDTDTSDVKILMIKDLEAGETPVTEGERMTEAEISDPNAGEGTIGGSISDINMDRIVIQSDDGDPYYFMVYGTDINLRNGFQEGNYVTVAYNGDIYGPDLVVATAITDAEDETDKVVSGPTQEGEHSYVNGVMTDCSLDSLTITTDDGEEITVNTVGATQCYSNGITEGNYVTVEYTGELKGTDTEEITVTAIYDYPDDSFSQDILYTAGYEEEYSEE